MDFPITDLLDCNKCYVWLLKFLHDGVLKSPSGGLNYIINDSRRSPIITYKDKDTGVHFNIFSGTIFQGTHFSCCKVVLIFRGFLQGVSTAQLSRELVCDYENLLELRHEFMTRGYENLNRQALEDLVTETDEMFQNAGEKGQKHINPLDPPRKRANKKRGHGTYENDRPPVVGTVGRETGKIRIEVKKDTKKASLNEHIGDFTLPASTANTDEWQGYNDISTNGRIHKTVCHAKKEYARDDDGDGIREVHTNTSEGIWTGLRNYLRIFRGVHKKYLHLYCACFELKFNYKEIIPKVVQALSFCNRILTI